MNLVTFILGNNSSILIQGRLSWVNVEKDSFANPEATVRRRGNTR
jgi:hypothetical protein